ncbi:MAG: thiamine pyrophosphate-dependent enzyme, partial [Halobacteria archaeon]|nr:thiamine pyrophosphate-dependent enzyme [Halobacteria archaeon]
STIAQKAEAYGFKGVLVDGMDALAVYEVTRRAVEKSKNPDDGLRPTLIEAIQYRYGAHTTADDPSKYRDEEEVERWRQKDPIPRMEGFLRDTGRLDDEKVDAVEKRVEEEIDEAVEKAESVEEPKPEDIFENVYANMTDELREQMEHVRRTEGGVGD